MNLKILLMRRIAAVAFFCLLGAALFVVYQARHGQQRQMQSVAEALGRQSEWQLLKIASGLDLPERFPDWDVLVQSGSLDGFCARLVKTDGTLVKSVCRGAYPARQSWPAGFAALYRGLFGGGSEVLRPVVLRHADYGKVIVSASAETLIARTWRDIGALFALSAATVVASSLMLYLTIGRALRPADKISAALDDLERGNWSARLPACELSELQRIGSAVNRLAVNLESSLAERAALSVKLLTVQEQERAHLARELHDEFGQCLAGINALAASIGQTARHACPGVMDESERIGAIAGHMLELLRGLLLRLRPPDIDELGLTEALHGLVQHWNACSGGKTRFDLELREPFAALPGAVAIHVYRIVQECLTNAAKHADASAVSATLAHIRCGETGTAHIAIVVEDDGTAAGVVPEGHAGSGLLGIRERVLALGGQVCIYTRETGGFGVRASIPVAP
ncbi:MAG: histidine kinase [Gammaproteobacteria bacterium]